MNIEKAAMGKTTKLMAGSLAFINLFIMQIILGKFGWAIADLFSYDSVDPNKLFARLSFHHLVQMLVALVVILIIKTVIHLDFGFHLGEKQEGRKYLLIFTLATAVVAVSYHVLMVVLGQPVTYGYPLNATNTLGYLGFQLFLSGPAEEIVYRALPVTLLAYAFGSNQSKTKDVSLEVVLASLLFTAAHLQWTVSPFSISGVNMFGLVYAFGMGILNGFVYQKSRSILYPILMHSISNVLMVGTGYLFAIFL